MTVESLIKSAISDEVNKAMRPEIVREVVDKKIERSVDKLVKVFSSKENWLEYLVTRSVISYLKSYDGQKLIADCVKNNVKVVVN